ncbi:MarR family winged helix-turn-helix transcriptional regulator [Nakamurella sp. PAMC28650]|jgi:DNA-binding MarR family transcriptional regulator|uniref:MarR family winged helix-turn-helix transcriptional regulator n=1 Tax=Nakamurella sp. PAMC28650 TaxID=2762325 RepID=UPI00164E4723|nr:MarR family transcriptional regulator [Nakamurella sp. PAMC28650]QNK83064.1 MarR family transcriptional regulator [Nakamurella sp. PAMC28650]
MSGPLRIEADRMDAWVGFLHAHAQILKKLADDLDAAGQIPLGTYDVLVQLSEAGGALRHRDLLDRLLISQPGLSRKVERLEVAGLVERRPDPQDGRGVIVKLSRAGRAALRSAAKVHMAGVDREFAQRLTDQEASVLAAVFRRLRDPDQPL